MQQVRPGRNSRGAKGIGAVTKCLDVGMNPFVRARVPFVRSRGFFTGAVLSLGLALRAGVTLEGRPALTSAALVHRAGRAAVELGDGQDQRAPDARRIEQRDEVAGREVRRPGPEHRPGARAEQVLRMIRRRRDVSTRGRRPQDGRQQQVPSPLHWSLP